MDFNKETFNLFKAKVEIIIVNLFPGALIIELFLGKGFIHNNIDTIYNFFLYILWSISISLLFNNIFDISNKKFIKKEIKKYLKNKAEVEEFIEKMESEEFEEINEEANAETALLYNSILIIIAYFLNQAINFLLTFFNQIEFIVNVNKNSFTNVAVFFIMLILKNLIKYLLLKTLLHKCMRNCINDTNKSNVT